MRIEWTIEAASELGHMLAYIALDDPSAAASVAEWVLRVEKTILTLPRAGRHDRETDSYDRYIPNTRIVLTYAIRDDVIWIITAWHTSRDPAKKPQRSV